MIVVDVGCYDHPNHQGASQDSIGKLIDRFRPRIVYGFDPHPSIEPGLTLRRGTQVIVKRAAAWTGDGLIPFLPLRETPLSARVGSGEGSIPVPCFNLVSFLTGLPFETGEAVTLKLDVEGAEYVLLPRIIDAGLDEFLDLLLIEWHALPERAEERDRLVKALHCPIEEWA